MLKFQINQMPTKRTQLLCYFIGPVTITKVNRKCCKIKIESDAILSATNLC